MHVQVVLANEAGISYVSVAMVTDYDCWRENEEGVSVEKVLAVLKQNVANVKNLMVASVESIGNQSWDETIAAKKVTPKKSHMSLQLMGGLFRFSGDGERKCDGLI